MENWEWFDNAEWVDDWTGELSNNLDPSLDDDEELILETPYEPNPEAMQANSNFDSFIPTYMNFVGDSEVPHRYHYWICLGIVSACLAKRVYIRRGHSQIFPNLYIFLIGPSGLGKNQAIDAGYDIIKAEGFQQDVNPHRVTSFTAMGLVDYLGKKGKKGQSVNEVDQAPPMLILTPELRESLGSKVIASDTITHMTNMYSGKENPESDFKRAAGHTVMRGQVFNWWAGSTEEWLKECIPVSAMEGGFLPRVAVIREQESDKRILFPDVTSRPKQVQNYLRKWAFLYTMLGNEDYGRVEREIRFDTQAREAMLHWYHNVHEAHKPTIEELKPTWRRQTDLVFKLAMVNSIADVREWNFGPDTIEQFWERTKYVKTPQDWSYSMTIRESHVDQAVRDSGVTMEAAPFLLDLVHSNPSIPNLVAVEKHIWNMRAVSRTDLARRFQRRLMARQLDQIIETLIDQGKVKIERRGGGKKKATFYVWDGD